MPIVTETQDVKRRAVDCWRAIECLNISEIEAPKAKNRIKDVQSDQDWPWHEAAYRRKILSEDAYESWFHVVYLGMCKSAPVVKEIFEVFDEQPNVLGRDLPKGHIACAALVVDDRGTVLDLVELRNGPPPISDKQSDEEHKKPKVEPEHITVSALPWAMGRLVTMAKDAELQFGSFDAAEDSLLASLESMFSGQADEDGEVAIDIHLNADSATKIIEKVFESFGWHPKAGYVLARCKSVKRKISQKKRMTPVEIDLFNSFFLKDLAQVSDAISSGDIGVALDSYLGAPLRGTQARLDLIANPDLAEALVHPSRLTPAGWPAKGDHSLVYAQQGAINTIFDKFADKDAEGIFSVNGPPGTGKTTMLRDAIATLVVKRARILSTLKSAKAAFQEEVELGDSRSVHKLDPALKGWEIVIASANNGAVENVTRELPSEKQVDERWLNNDRLPEDQVKHFAELATSLLRPKEPYHSDEDESAVADEEPMHVQADEVGWALLGAVLGNSSNRRTFVSRFWFGKKSKDQSIPGLKDIIPDMLLATKPGPEFRAAQKNFRDADARVERLIGEMVAFARLGEELGSARKRLADHQVAIDAAEARRKQAVLSADSLNDAQADARHRFEAARLYEAAARSHHVVGAAKKEYQDAEQNLAELIEAQASQTTSIDASSDVNLLEDRLATIDHALASHEKSKLSWWEKILSPRSIEAWRSRQGELDIERLAAGQLIAAARSEHRQRSQMAEKLANRIEEARSRARTIGQDVRKREAFRDDALANLRSLSPARHAELIEVLEDADPTNVVAAALRATRDAEAEVLQLDVKLAAARRAADEAIAASRDAKQRYGEMTAAITHQERSITASSGAEVIVDHAFRNMTDDEQQLSSPWMSEELRVARIELFLAALRLHRAFLVAAWRSGLSKNLNMVVDMLRGTAPEQATEHLSDLWATLFLAVPVVSTTFASVSRLFRGMGRGSLGWLFIDEAGQAVPQAAVGALWRARRAVVVGDPLQLKPVVTMPAQALALLQRKFALPVGYSPDGTSVQKLADDANPIGAHLNDGDTWVGCPLRVHRRCEHTMFAVANEIAYDGLMVYGKTPNRTFFPRFGDSGWIDVPNAGSSGHWVEQEGRIAIDMVREIIEKDPEQTVFVISPFRAVITGFNQLVESELGEMAADWRSRNVGTVHTFQGKEADTVILLLGGDPAVPGAMSWAASPPNLLNVAVTRAKERLYVIGDRDRWTEMDTFEVLAANLRQISPAQLHSSVPMWSLAAT